jgi:hypothetical protein
MIMVVCALALWIGSASATPGTLHDMSEVGAAIRACWTPALLFSFTRDGMLGGPPQVTASNVPGGAEERHRLAGSALAALEHCTPLHLAAALADNIAGLAFTMQFVAERSGSR